MLLKGIHSEREGKAHQPTPHRLDMAMTGWAGTRRPSTQSLGPCLGIMHGNRGGSLCTYV